MACNCTPPSNTCTSCNPCVTTTTCTEPWTITNVVSNLTSCITPEYCDTGCVDTLQSDCVILSEIIECEGGVSLIAGITLTNVLKYLFCSRDYTFVITDSTASCNISDTGTITLDTDVTTYTFVLKNNLGVQVDTISNPDLVFTGVAPGDYTIEFNGVSFLEITIASDADIC